MPPIEDSTRVLSTPNALSPATEVRREAEASNTALWQINSQSSAQIKTLVGQKTEWMDRALAAEARLAEAMDILEFYAEPFEYIKKHGLEEQTPDFYDKLDTGARARDFLNAAKEKTDAVG